MTTATSSQSIAEFCAEHNIRVVSAQPVDSSPNHVDDGYEMDHWKVTLGHGRQRMTIYYSMGIGLNGETPTVTDILDNMASDASGFTDSFEDWASEYGYDTDSRKAEKVYRAVERQTKKLQQFMGDQFDTLLYNVERE